MELSFGCENSADASYLAQELEFALRQEGVPPKALRLKQSSVENMDVGSVLAISMDSVAHALGSLGYIACFAKCIYEVVSKHPSTVLILNKDGELVRLPPGKLTRKRIENALAKPRRPKSRKSALKA
jgi:hypothetical protein